PGRTRKNDAAKQTQKYTFHVRTSRRGKRRAQTSDGEQADACEFERSSYEHAWLWLVPSSRPALLRSILANDCWWIALYSSGSIVSIANAPRRGGFWTMAASSGFGESESWIAGWRAQKRKSKAAPLGRRNFRQHDAAAFGLHCQHIAVE